MYIFSADLYELITVWRIHYAAPVLALLLAFLWVPGTRKGVESAIGKGPCAFITGALSAVLACIVGVVVWQMLPGASAFAATQDPEAAPSLIDWQKVRGELDSNFRSRWGLPIYYYVPWLTIGVIMIFCALDRLDKIAESRSTMRKVIYWTIVPAILLVAALVSFSYRFPEGFAASFVLLGVFVIVAVWRNFWPDAALFVKGMSTALFLLLAFLAALNYYNFAKWRYGDFFNAYEFYHYYIGAKYAPEVGYMGMYEASLVADEETGLKYNNAKGGVRNLTTGRYYATREEVLDRRDEIKGWFSNDRWDEFVKDITFFKGKLVKSRWDGMLRDKGYNATPVWTAIVGGGLSNIVSTDNTKGMYLLSMLDQFLICAAALCIVWAFGPNAAFIMLIVLGTSYVMKYSHMKGAYLRTDFCMSIIIAICLVKKDCYRLAGAFTAYSIMSRVFPAALLFGIGAKFFWDLFPTFWRAPIAWVKQGVTASGAALSVIGGIIFWLGFTVLPVIAIALFKTELYSEHKDQIHLAALVAGGVLSYFSITSLWGLYAGGVKRGYAWFFVSVAVTLVVLFGVSITYAALTPDYDRYAKELRSDEPDISNTMLRVRFLTRYWEEYAVKIGRHNKDISPWRVGFKYLFINQWPKKEAPWTQAYNHVKENGPAASWDALHVQNKTPRENIEQALKNNKPYTRSARWNDKETEVTFLGKTLTLYEWRWLIPISVIALSLFLMIGLKDHEAFAYSFVPVFFLAASTYYYYIMLLIPLLFFSPHIGRPSRAIGAIMIVFAAMPGYYLYRNLGWAQQFPTYYYHSVMYGILCVYMMLCAGGDTLAALKRMVFGTRGGDTPDLEPVPASSGAPAGFDPAVPPPPRFFDPAPSVDDKPIGDRSELARLEDTPIESGSSILDDEPDAADSANSEVEYTPPAALPLDDTDDSGLDTRPLDAIENTPHIEPITKMDAAPEADVRPLEEVENAPPFEIPESMPEPSFEPEPASEPEAEAGETTDEVAPDEDEESPQA